MEEEDSSGVAWPHDLLLLRDAARAGLRPLLAADAYAAWANNVQAAMNATAQWPHLPKRASFGFCGTSLPFAQCVFVTFKQARLTRWQQQVRHTAVQAAATHNSFRLNNNPAHPPLATRRHRPHPERARQRRCGRLELRHATSPAPPAFHL